MNEFIKTEIFNKDLGKLYSDLFDWRHEGDYSDFVLFDKHITMPLIDKSKDFIKNIQSYIETKRR